MPKRNMKGDIAPKRRVDKRRVTNRSGKDRSLKRHGSEKVEDK